MTFPFAIFFLFFIFTKSFHHLVTCPTESNNVFNLCFYDKGNYISTTCCGIYGAGYGIKLKVDSSQTDIRSTSETYLDIKIVTKLINISDQVGIRHELQNTGIFNRKVSVAVHADTEIHNNDRVPIYRVDPMRGFRFADSGYEVYLLFLQNYEGHLPIDSLWYGYYSDRHRNLWVNATNSSYTNGDSGLAYSWQNYTLKPNDKVSFTAAFTTNQHFNFSIIPSYIPSEPFTPSRTFTRSFIFSKSEIFTQSDFFKSPFFTKSKFFSKSQVFTKSLIFSESSFFAQSEMFSKSQVFTKSLIFSESSFFAQSEMFSNSRFFTKSLIFSKSTIFTQSDFFSMSNYFSNSKIFTESVCNGFSESDLNDTFDSTYIMNSNNFNTNYVYTENNSNFFSLYLSNSNELAIIPKLTPTVAKKGANIIMIIGIICGIVAVIAISIVIVIVVLKRRGNENSAKESQSMNTTFIDSRQINTKSQPELLVNIEDDDRDLNFWL